MAAVTADRVVVELEARLDRYEQRISHATRHFDKSMATIQGSANRTERVVSGAMRNLAGVIGTVSVIALARGLLSIADEAKNLNAQLKLATAQTGSFGKATDDVRRIAEITRSGLTDTAVLYGNFQRNARELGITQEEAARATETVAKTFKISGASATEAAQGIRQLVQGLQSGTLRGDEFNTIMESSPRLARLLAQSLGVPIGSLRALAEAGDLTSEKLVRAFTDTKFTDAIDAEFKQLPVTFDQAMEQVHNAAIITFGAFDQGGEFSKALANFITQGTSGFADLERSAEETGIEIRAAFEGLGNAFDPMMENANSVFSSIAFQALSLRDSIASLLGTLDSVHNFGQGIARRIDLAAQHATTLEVPLPIIGRVKLPPLYRARTDKELPDSDLKGRFLRRFDESQRQGRARAGERFVTDRYGFANNPELARKFGFDVPDTGGGPVARAGKQKTKKGPSAETLARRAEAARVAAERRQQAFDNEEASLQRDLLDARRALTNAANIRAQFELQEIETERAAYADSLVSQVSQKKLTEAEAEKLRILNDQVAAAKSDLVKKREAERNADEDLKTLQEGLSTEADLLQADLKLANTREELAQIESRLLDIQIEQEKAALERLKATLDAVADAKEIARINARLAALPELREKGRASIARDNESPLDRYRRDISNVGTSINDQMEQVQVDGLRALEDGLTNSIAKVFQLKGAFGEMANAIIADIIRMQIQKMILAAIGGVESGGGWLGAAFGAAKAFAGFGGGGVSHVGTYGADHGESLSFGGFRAKGGPVSPGKGYVVGENGPEWFSPGQAGQIIPQGRNIRPVDGNVAARVHAAVKNYIINVSADHSVTPAGFARDLASRILQEAAKMDANSRAATVRGTPGRISSFNKLGT